MLTGLIDPLMPPEVVFLNSNYDLINYNFQMVQSCKMQFFTRLFRFELDTLKKSKMRQATGTTRNQDDSMIEREFNRILQGAFMELASDLVKKGLAPCIVSSLKFQEKMHTSGNSNFFDIFFTCSVMSTSAKEDVKQVRGKPMDPWFKLAAINEEVPEVKAEKSSSESPFTLRKEGSQTLKQKADSNSNQHYYIKLAQNERA